MCVLSLVFCWTFGCWLQKQSKSFLPTTVSHGFYISETTSPRSQLPGTTVWRGAWDQIWTDLLNQCWVWTEIHFSWQLSYSSVDTCSSTCTCSLCCVPMNGRWYGSTFPDSVIISPYIQTKLKTWTPTFTQSSAAWCGTALCRALQLLRPGD